MYTKQQLQAAISQVPNEFSLAELEIILNRKADPDPFPLPVRPANLTPEQAADWDYYMSPEAIALYRKFPISPEVRALRGIAAGLSEEDKKKTAKEWEAERIKEKYGV